MALQSNALGVTGEADKALVSLVLKYELVTGSTVKWRKSEEDIYEMVGVSVKHSDRQLRTKAYDFLSSLPTEVFYEFHRRRITGLEDMESAAVTATG